MADCLPPVAKRQRQEQGPSSSSQTAAESSNKPVDVDVAAVVQVRDLVSQCNWEEALERVQQHPEEANTSSSPSPLALACRLGAPAKCVKAILDACPEKLRLVVDSRGTPLHEAIVCERVGADVIETLLKADEAMVGGTRAALLQDVDGFTPLHVLIRRRFQSDILSTDDGLIEILEMLVKSCAQAVVVPDRGEYEEPPIVYALKANLYAPMLGSEDSTTARVERRIYEMVACMLRHYPEAACCVFAGYRGQYTAVHSAVFHGRSPYTLELLLQAESTRCNEYSASNACMLANTQGEMPLHFCTMRGEPPQSVALLAKAAPDAIHARDASGLMPTHWLWVRFVSTLVALEDGGRGSDDTVTLGMPSAARPSTSKYSQFASFEHGDLERDLLVIQRLDPSVDFLRMRHIPLEVLGEEDSLRWASRTADILNQVRIRHSQFTSGVRASDQPEEDAAEGAEIVWTRREAVASIFWKKLVSLLETSRQVGEQQPIGNSTLVHTAFANACFLPAVARLVATLFPEEMSLRDERGRLPLHYSAARDWHALDWPPEGASDDDSSRPSRLFYMETLRIMRAAMQLSSDDAASVADNDGRLPLHFLVETFVKACSKRAWSDTDQPIREMLNVMKSMVQLYPNALHRRDPVTDLYPCFQATAVATECTRSSNAFCPELQLSIAFILLRNDPTLISSDTNA